MKIKNILYTFIGALILLAYGCELVDPTEVVNPNLTEETILSTDNPITPLVRGVQRQAALLSQEHITISEIASDNYENTQTFYNQNLDNLTIRSQDADMNALGQDLARLRELADYGLETVAPADPATTGDQLAELYFWKAYSFMIASELFSSLPGEPNGPAISSEQNADSALVNFNLAISQSGATSDIIGASQLASARVHRSLGNKTEAVSFAQSAISTTPNLVFNIQFDQQNGPLNEMQTALYDRGGFDDLQVLPRLDFLDPKYYRRNATDASPLAILKIEEAHLIIAEAQLSDQNLAAALVKMQDVIDLVGTRAIESFSNEAQDRTQRSPGSRPDSTDIIVAASSQAPFREGLVLYRKGDDISVPVISGTSVDAAYLSANATTIDEALETLYLMRQEIFIAEGRRIMDMGVKFVIGEIEYLSNPNIDINNPGTTPVIPEFISAIADELDAFSYDPVSREVVITHNVNRILVQNKTSTLVLPFE